MLESGFELVLIFAVALAPLLLALRLCTKVLGIDTNPRFVRSALKILNYLFGFSAVDVGAIAQPYVPQTPGTPGYIPGRSISYFPIGRSWLIFAMTFLIWVAVKLTFLVVGLNGTLGIMLFLVFHVSCGVFLNRRILSFVIWQKHLTVLTNLSVVKLMSVIFWPCTYPVFLTQFLIARYL